jgi:hypothetical protein
MLFGTQADQSWIPTIGPTEVVYGRTAVFLTSSCAEPYKNDGNDQCGS